MAEEKEEKKTLDSTTAKKAKDNVKDHKVWGESDVFKLISKASSKKEGWMKSTKAMEITGVGCVIQVTTQQGDNIAEAVCFTPGVRIMEDYAPVKKRTKKEPKLIGRRIVAINYKGK